MLILFDELQIKPIKDIETNGIELRLIDNFDCRFLIPLTLSLIKKHNNFCQLEIIS